MGTSNMQRLGEVLSSRMKKSANAAVTITAELGTIHSNLSLTTDSLKTPIPKGDYMVSATLTGSFFTSAVDGGEYHDHRLPENFRALQSGDRVLVVWCGNEPVVIAKVVSS